MDSLTFLTPFFVWLLHTSWQAGVLVCLILLVQKALGRWIGVRGRYCLWLVLLIRLVLPWAPPSPVSIYNLLPVPLPKVGAPPASVAGRAHSAVAAAGVTSAATTPDAAAAATDETRTFGAAVRLVLQKSLDGPLHASVWLPLFWLAGVSVLAGCIVRSHLRLWRSVRRGSPVTEERILALLEDCHGLMGTTRAVRVVATDGVDGPALFGVLRPRLLLPRPALTGLSLPELRHIFLHELAHLRRHDIALGYLVTLLHVLHWFNPLLALGLRRMRADREPVCDGLALSVLAPEETGAYGRTLLRQVEQLLASRSHWTLAGLAADPGRIKQRIIVISRFRKETYRWSPLALVLVGVVACAALTDRPTGRKAEVDGPARDVPTTHQDRHGNIVRIHLRHRDSGKYLLADGDRVVCGFDEPGDAGLWEARFDDDLGNPDDTVYFYSVAARKYLTSDQEGNLAVDGLEPDETARWIVRARTDGARITPCQFPHSYLRLCRQGGAKAVHGTAPWIGWDIDQLWRVKTSDNPKSNPQWRREHVPGPD
jgi:beta-lactamase regulating signal transducer with metallopeptidase domain